MDSKEKEILIKKVKELYAKISEVTVNTRFTMPDNCPGDGWDGSLQEDGAYMYGNNHFEGEFFKYEDMDIDDLESLLYEVEYEADVDVE